MLMAVLAVTAVRILYLLLLCPLELVADEAHYWEWSRRLALSYYTKGPGVAWAIAASTGLFGDNAFAVRLPAVLSSGVMLLVGMQLARELSADRRAGWYAGLALLLLPGYLAISQLLTTDIFYCTCWLTGAWLFWRALREDRLGFWAALGLCVGVGFLFKYTMLLFVPGVLWHLLRERRRSLAGVGIGAIAFLAAASPVIIWNQLHGWPTVTHQLGRVGLPGGDEAVAWNWSPFWFLEFAGAQLGLLGVFGAVLIVMAWRWVRTAPPTTDRVGLRLLVRLAVPILGFYFVLSVFKRAQGNWALAGYTTLLVLVGCCAADVMPKWKARLRTWKNLPKPRPKWGIFLRRPETPFQLCWHWFVGVGVVAALFVMAGPLVLGLPGLRDVPALQTVSSRLSGTRQRAAEVQGVRDNVGNDVPIVAGSYQQAGLLAFYLPDQPVTYSAKLDLGGRPSAYDFFPDTDLHGPALLGRDMLLIDGQLSRWRETFRFDTVEPVDDEDGIYLGRNFQGLR